MPWAIEKHKYLLLNFATLLASIVLNSIAHAENGPNTSGQTGLINTPNARIETDGVFRIGLAYLDPYTTSWISISALPRLEFSARYTAIANVEGFRDQEYGDYKDKAFDTKIQLFSESQWIPAVSVGVQDFLGTRVFAAEYFVASKRFGDVDISLGKGRRRIDGIFGGVRYTPFAESAWSFLAEHDATRYDTDLGASLSGAGKRLNKPAWGVEYRYGWLAGRLLQQGEVWGVNVFVSIPLMENEFVPKLHEPLPYAGSEGSGVPEKGVDVTAIERGLVDQGFRNITLERDDATLRASVTHPRIYAPGRVAGRAARVLEAHSSEEIENFDITVTENELPVISYDVRDRAALRGFFSFEKKWDELVPSLSTRAPQPDEAAQEKMRIESNMNQVSSSTPIVDFTGTEGHFVSFQREDNFLNSWRVVPFNLSTFFNDPSGAFRYDIFATANFDRRLAPKTLLKARARLTLLEDVSDVTQASNSTLPHVRSDVADYKREGPLKLDSLYINKLFHFSTGTYGRATVGYYEEMFGGVGGQLIYFPIHKPWAVDLSVDGLWQREVGGGLEFRDYSVVTSVLAFHYHLPWFGVNATLRTGRFLAKDDGARLEMARRFNSGIELGAWYAVTNGNDITSPGSPDDPYDDKGLFIIIPLRTMLTQDTRAAPRLSLSPWSRDVGQLVRSPGDLYRLMDERLGAEVTMDEQRLYFGQ